MNKKVEEERKKGKGKKMEGWNKHTNESRKLKKADEQTNEQQEASFKIYFSPVSNQ